MSSSIYTLNYLNSLGIPDLRLIAQRYGTVIPREKSKLISFIIEQQSQSQGFSGSSRIMSNTISRELSRAKPIPKTVAIGIYEREFFIDETARILRDYYMFQIGTTFSTIISSYVSSSIEDQKFILNELGLLEFKGEESDLISLLNLIPGLKWNIEKAKEITSLTMSEALSLSQFDYLNIVLAYATGYYLEYDLEYKNYPAYALFAKKTPKYAIMTYLAVSMLPDITEATYKYRPTNHAYAILSKLNVKELNEITPLLDFATKTNTSEAVRHFKMIPPPGKSDQEYFLNSILEYRHVIVNSGMPEKKSDAIRNLIRYNDQILLEIAEEPITYTYRYDLENKVRDLLKKYKWSLNRSKFCKHKIQYNYPVLSYGTALNYYCFDYREISRLWSEEEIRKNKGFLRPDYREGEPHKYLTSLEVNNLKHFLENHPEKSKFNDILPALVNFEGVPLRERGKQNKGLILVICYDDDINNVLNPVVIKALKSNFNVNFDRYEIDYIGYDIMFLDDVHVIIENDIFPDENSLKALSDIKYKYDFIIYEGCPLGSDEMPMHKLIDYSVLNVLRDKLKESGYVILTENRAKNVNRIGEIFQEIRRIERYGGRQLVIFDKYKIGHKIPSDITPVKQTIYPPVTNIFKISPPVPTSHPSILPPWSPVFPPPISQPSTFPSPIPVPQPSVFPPPIPTLQPSTISTPKTPIEEALGVDWKMRWDVITNPGGGDCLYCVIVTALNSVGNNYNVQELRDIVAQSVTLDNLDEWKNEIIADKLFRVTLEPEDISKGLDFNRKRIAVAKQLRSKTYTVANIQQEIRSNRYGSIDDLKIISEFLDFIPIVIPIIYGTDDIYLNQMCGGIRDYDAIFKGGDLFTKNIILIKWDPGAPHFDLFVKGVDRKNVLRYGDLPQKLIDLFLRSCERIKEFSY